jgi:SAM-dependent methyltransferase
MDWTDFWRKDTSGALSEGPSTLSRLRVVMPLVREFAKQGGSLLDVGCGTGTLLARARALGLFQHLVGVDLSEVPLGKARVACPDARFVVADVCRAPLAEKFDLITCLMTLDLVSDEARAAKHLGDMLAPAGHLIVVVQHDERHRSELDNRYGVRRHDRSSLKRRFAEHDLECVELFTWGFPLFNFYYRIMERSGAGQVGSEGVPPLARRIATLCLPAILRVDDLFKWTDRGRVLYGVFRKPR